MVGVGLAVACVAIAAFVYSSKVDAPTEVMVDGTVQDQRATAKKGNTLRDLLALGQSQKCTYSSTIEGTTSDGTMYISGAKMRGDFATKTTVNGTTVSTESHMITDGKEMRMWTEGESMGILMENIDAQTDTKNPNTPVKNDMVDLDTDMNYNCEPWTARSSFFEAPGTVTFHSMTDMMQMNMPKTAPVTDVGGDVGMGAGMEAGGMADMKAMQCQMCAQAPDAASKAQCLKTFACE